jgi:hypothetical protein
MEPTRIPASPPQTPPQKKNSPPRRRSKNAKTAAVKTKKNDYSWYIGNPNRRNDSNSNDDLPWPFDQMFKLARTSKRS